MFSLEGRRSGLPMGRPETGACEAPPDMWRSGLSVFCFVVPDSPPGLISGVASRLCC